MIDLITKVGLNVQHVPVLVHLGEASLDWMIAAPAPGAWRAVIFSFGGQCGPVLVTVTHLIK